MNSTKFRLIVWEYQNIETESRKETFAALEQTSVKYKFPEPSRQLCNNRRSANVGSSVHISLDMPMNGVGAEEVGATREFIEIFNWIWNMFIKSKQKSLNTSSFGCDNTANSSTSEPYGQSRLREQGERNPVMSRMSGHRKNLCCAQMQRSSGHDGWKDSKSITRQSN